MWPGVAITRISSRPNGDDVAVFQHAVVALRVTVVRYGGLRPGAALLERQRGGDVICVDVVFPECASR